MIPGVNPRQMQQMMKKMGVKQEEIPAEEVIIKTREKNLIIRNPNVQKVQMMGQETIQITGDIEEEEQETTPEITEEDIQTVRDATGASREEAKEAIENTEGDLAKAIINLKE